jgi:hypothetical protein
MDYRTPTNCPMSSKYAGSAIRGDAAGGDPITTAPTASTHHRRGFAHGAGIANIGTAGKFARGCNLKTGIIQCLDDALGNLLGLLGAHLALRIASSSIANCFCNQGI